VAAEAGQEDVREKEGAGMTGWGGPLKGKATWMKQDREGTCPYHAKLRLLLSATRKSTFGIFSPFFSAVMFV
jgi:hypothetical protein